MINREAAALDIKLLQTFLVTARTLNFRQAAEQLYLAQPTVTQHIRQLEQELRVELFDRTTRRVRLTPAGERFLSYASGVVELYRRGMQDLAGWRQGYRDRLVLAVSPVVARYTLPRVLKRFIAERPEVEVVVRTALSHEVAPMVADGRAHLGLSRMASPSRDLHSYTWYTEPLMLVVPNDGADLDAPPPDWRVALQSHRLLTHNHPVYWDSLLLGIYNQGIQVRTMEVSQVDITKRFIEEGLGISFLPHTTVWRELAEGRLLEVPTPGLTLPTAATYVIHPAQGPAEAAAGFMETVARFPI